MKLQLSTWPEVEQYLTRSKAIIIPIGSTEQHGPNGLIGTDAICPEVVADGASEQLNLLVAPTIHVGIAQHHMEFPGSMTLRPSTLIAVLVDTITSLALHGFEDLYFINGHGGNIATVRAAFSEYYSQHSLEKTPHPPARAHFRNWWDGDRVTAYRKQHFMGVEGSHATPTEVALTYYFHPTKTDNSPLQPEVAPRGRFYDAKDYREKFPDGRIGSNPALATPTHGEKIYEAAVADFVDVLTEN